MTSIVVASNKRVYGLPRMVFFDRDTEFSFDSFTRLKGSEAETLAAKLMDKNDLSYLAVSLSLGKKEFVLEGSSIIAQIVDDGDVGNIKCKVVYKFQVNVDSLDMMDDYDSDNIKHRILLKKCLGTLPKPTATSIAKALYIPLQSLSHSNTAKASYKAKPIALLRRDIMNWFKLPSSDADEVLS